MANRKINHGEPSFSGARAAWVVIMICSSRPPQGINNESRFQLTAAAQTSAHVSRRLTVVLTVNIYELLHSFLLGEVQSHVISTWTTSATAWKVGGTNILSTHFEHCVWLLSIITAQCSSPFKSVVTMNFERLATLRT
jgi:hypothetical protein